jgi:hypothetical protein
MANSLVSPGVQVTVIDESNYAPTAVGTIPLIILATAQDKMNAAGLTADATTKANAGKVYNIGDQRSLVSQFGLPIFPTDHSGNRMYGDERSEYGLWAAHNVLGAISSAYIVRADVDLAQLEPSHARPTAQAAGGTLWLDSAISRWGVFEWDADNQVFVQQKVAYLTDAVTEVLNGHPRNSYGNLGDYAIVGTLVNGNYTNPLYYKSYDGHWVPVGSNYVPAGAATSWYTSQPAVSSTVANVTNITPGHTIVINGVTITASGATDDALASNINAANITGITARINPKSQVLEIFVSNTAKSDGSTVDGKMHLVNGTNGSTGAGTILTREGLIEGYYAGLTVQFSKHSTVPQWKSFQTVPRPSGSLWIKTTNFNYGANIATYRRNTVTENWDLVPNLLFANDAEALATLDPTRGGLGIAMNSLYTQYGLNGLISDTNSGVVNAGTVNYKILKRYTTGPTVVTGLVSNPTLTTGDAFTISASQVSTSTLTNVATITIGANGTASATYGVSQLINGVPALNGLVTASVDSLGRLIITHNQGGVIQLKDSVNTPLEVLGITTDIINVRTDYIGNLIVSNWVDIPSDGLVQQSYEPTSVPADGVLWYSDALEADIMINVNHVWKGYRNAVQDARGYNLSNTDPLGPIFSPTKPDIQSTDPVTGAGGSALVYGDIWINTADMENYPQIYRWESIQGTDQWVQIDTADASSENGIVFGDARWDNDGAHDIFLDEIVPIKTMLNSNYTDLDILDPSLYPPGCLLFNTRRSTLNVKKYILNYFNVESFPNVSLPSTLATWQSYSGKQYNNVPFFGRKAQRNVVVSAMKEAVDLSTDLLEEGRPFNLLCAPGYPELLLNLKELNDNRKNTGFIIGEVPLGLPADQTKVENYLIDALGTGLDGEDGITIGDPYVAVFYPGGATVNALDGVGSVVVPISALILKTMILSDQNSELWFAPAGNARGAVDAIAIGYVDRTNFNAFVRTGTPQGMRDLLYRNDINPVTYFPQVGYINYGNHTRQKAATALDRINVARLVAYLRERLEQIVRPLVFEPNDKITRDKAKAICDQLLNDVAGRRGLYDFLVVCDRTNNTNATIDRNELHIDIAIEPVKAVEFIYIPVRVKATGQLRAGNIAPSIPIN